MLYSRRSQLASNRAAFSRSNLAALGGADTAGLGTPPAVVMAVNSTLLRAPFAHESAECADFLDVSTVSRHCTDAELTKLQTLVAVTARDERTSGARRLLTGAIIILMFDPGASAFPRSHALVLENSPSHHRPGRQSPTDDGRVVYLNPLIAPQRIPIGTRPEATPVNLCHNQMVLAQSEVTNGSPLRQRSCVERTWST